MKQVSKQSFFEKKDQKTFDPGMCHTATHGAGSKEKKFFGSFFQKRTFFLCLLFATPSAYAQMEAPTVSTTVVHDQLWQPTMQAVGSLRAARGADLAAEVPGIVDWIGFDSGRDVAAGTLLLRLRPNDDDAKLAELQAAADLAAANLARDTKQYRAQAVSQATIDADNSHLRAARAQVAEQQATMNEKLVRAPFAGRLGLRQVDLGQYLPAGTTIVTLQALDPIFVDFYVPQQALASVRPGEEAVLHVDTYPGRSFVAHIAAISPKLDQASRMAQIRATIANPNHDLLPGMFATVTVGDGPQARVVTVPDAAIVYNPYGSAVFVVSPSNPPTVHQTLVKTGLARGDQVQVLAGLKPGETIVTSGQIKLHDGSPITINNSVQPADLANPNPVEE
jgi:membrane fusion protein (multidrug efflux system)